MTVEILPCHGPPWRGEPDKTTTLRNHRPVTTPTWASTFLYRNRRFYDAENIFAMALRRLQLRYVTPRFTPNKATEKNSLQHLVFIWTNGEGIRR